MKDKISGYVLKKDSNYNDYVKKIIHLYNNPDIYKKLCQTTLDRYNKELTWESQRQFIKTIFGNAIK